MSGSEILGATSNREATRRRIWTPNRVIKLGTVADEAAMREALTAAGRRIEWMASEALLQVNYSPYTPEEPRDVNLVFVSNEDLGLTDEWVPLENTHAVGLQQGLELCEWEDGPQLAAQYENQPNGEVLLLAMKHIINKLDLSSHFAVVHDYRGLGFDAYYGNPGDKCRRSRLFVFRCRPSGVSDLEVPFL